MINKALMNLLKVAGEVIQNLIQENESLKEELNELKYLSRKG